MLLRGSDVAAASAAPEKDARTILGRLAFSSFSSSVRSVIIFCLRYFC